MNKLATIIETLAKTHPRVIAYMEKYIRKIPRFKNEIDEKLEEIVPELESTLKPYAGKFETNSCIPGEGRSQQSILSEISQMTQLEETRWREGYVSGAVYHGDPAHIEFMNKVYALSSQTNPLHSDLFPSISKYESEIVAMTANMLGSSRIDEDICGTISSGGTESILLAMKTYRDWAGDEKGIRKPEMIVPVTAHAAFDKAAEYFKIRIRKVPVDMHFRADISAVKKALNRNTVVIVGSAPNFPYGVIDPIEELSEIASNANVGCHVDACLGGFFLPWIEKLGHGIPKFDFRLPGVTSISADTHKFGYAAKGTSVILYRTLKLRHYQYFTVTDWPGGLYFSPTFAGSRSGALSAMSWASLLSMGVDGYMDSAKKIMDTAKIIIDGIRDIPELKIFGEPLWIIAFSCEDYDIFRIMDFMTSRHWNLNGLHRPSCVHFCTTLRHTQPGVAEKFVDDLRLAVEHVKSHPADEDGMAPVYGLAANIPLRGIVSDLLKKVMDIYYKVK